jgi:hypothetical protein
LEAIFHAIPIKISMSFFTEIKKSILKFIWMYKKPQMESWAKKKKQHWRYHNIYIYTYMYTHTYILQSNKHKHVDQWNRIEDPETSPHSYSPLIFNKGIQNIHWRKDSLFNKWD